MVFSKARGLLNGGITKKTLTIDDVILDRIVTEQKKLTALWYAKMCGEIAWIDEGEKENFEREFARLEREIRIADFMNSPDGYLIHGEDGLEKLRQWKGGKP